jgi:hypothetical protein
MMRTFSDCPVTVPLTSNLKKPWSVIAMPIPGTSLKTSTNVLAPIFRISLAVITVAIAGASLNGIARRVEISSSSGVKYNERNACSSAETAWVGETEQSSDKKIRQMIEILPRFTASPSSGERF